MSETSARRRIREAVESRGFSLASLSYTPAVGWEGTTTEKIFPNMWPGDCFEGRSVDECLADIDWALPTPGPCGCERPASFYPLGRLKGWPSKVGCHDEGCRWFIRYRLPWWTEHGYDWSGWRNLGSWAASEAQRPKCLCGFQGTPEECQKERAEADRAT